VCAGTCRVVAPSLQKRKDLLVYTLTVGISMIEPKLPVLAAMQRRSTLSTKERLQRDSFFSCIGQEVFMKERPDPLHAHSKKP
jgi:hypothetical protein